MKQSPSHAEPGPPRDEARPVVVAISGGSATGKSTLTRALAETLSDLEPVILAQDRYFRDFMEYPEHERERARTANHPDAVNWRAFHAAFSALIAGERIVEPAEGTSRRARGEPESTLGPGGLILVEGLFALWDERCRAVADLRLYTEVSDDERVLRRVYRDITERGSTLERVVSWYRRDVQPNHPTYTAATRGYADLVVPTDRPNEAAVRAIAGSIRALALDRREVHLGGVVPESVSSGSSRRDLEGLAPVTDLGPVSEWQDSLRRDQTCQDGNRATAAQRDQSPDQTSHQPRASGDRNP